MATTVVDQGIKCYRSLSYSLIQGDSMVITIPVVDSDDTDIDVTTGYAFDFQIKAGSGLTSALAFTEASDEVAMGDGSVVITIPAEDTVGLASNQSLFVGSRLTELAGDTTVTLVEGMMSIKESLVTRATDIAVTSVTGLPDALALVEADVVQLAVIIAPVAATDKRLTWASDDTDVATVSATGVVTAVLAGTCGITATSVDDATKADTCAITVTATPAAPDP